MSDLASQTCEPCRGGVDPLDQAAIDALLPQLGEGWEAIDGHHLTRTWSFPDFAQALAFVDAIGALAEEQGHHPDLSLSWGRVRIELYTHKIDGLHLADFVLAAKIDELGGSGST
ncbi:MAG TPA: 4a-hydroxytetrahydrobiopterin dehydratase [Deltaproteobacteria bacterium]|nr:4a-hydroxytetrahydrobiopterin dehydratase [Deltaproteobacteria bacterium]